MSQFECPSCRAALPVGTKFCTSCGAKISVVAPPSSPPPPPPAAPEPQGQGGGIPRPAPAGFSPPPRQQGMVQYDPVVIQSYADALYRAADRIVLVTALLGGLLGGIVGYALGAAMGSGSSVIFGLVGLGAGGFIGHSRGMSKTFQLRLEAQLALCQVEIEFNTRPLRGS